MKSADPSAATTLWNQYNKDSGLVLSSQDFEIGFDQYDTFQADDFIIYPGETWTITSVSVAGQYYNGSGPADSENVTIYADAAGLPGRILKTTTATGTDTAGAFTVKVPKFKLTAGHYWLGFQANMDLAVGGQWGWDGRKATVFGTAGAVFENPRNGFGTGCTSWTATQTCAALGQGPDLVFRIKGTRVV